MGAKQAGGKSKVKKLSEFSIQGCKLTKILVDKVFLQCYNRITTIKQFAAPHLRLLDT
jgi:hypothetical protein